MKTSTRLNLLLASVCLGVADGLVQLEFTRQAGGAASLAGRDSLSMPFSKGGNFAFVVNATIGTPGQAVSLFVSPSIPDTWVPDATTSYCDESYYDYDNYYSDDVVVENPTYCLLGAFNMSRSSTYLTTEDYTYFSSGDGSFASGVNGTDTLKVGEVELKDFPIGSVTRSTNWVGVLGLGSNGSYSSYNNFPDRLLQTGQINTKAYSIWLDDPAGKSGSILFGAIDTSRYEGELVRISGYASYAHYLSFGVEVTGFNGSSSSSDAMEELAWSELPFDATIGPAEIVSNLPYDMASKIWDLSGATYNDTIGAAVIPCDAADGDDDDDGTRLQIQLTGPGGPLLKVHLSDLIIPTEVSRTMTLAYYMQTPDLCLFAVQNSTSSSSSYGDYNLGSSMLRRTYMVFDIENSEVALAPTKFTGRADPNVVEFASIGAPAPSATRYCVSSQTDYPYVCDIHSTSQPTPSFSGPSGDGSSYFDGNSTARRNGTIGLAVAFGLVALIALVATIIIWKRVCCGPRNKVGLGPESDTDAENVPTAAATTAAAADGQRNSVMGYRQPLETIPESEMAQANNRHFPVPLPVLPPLPPGSVSAPSTDHGTLGSTDQATAPEAAQTPSPELEDNSRGREVSELGEPSAAEQGR